MRCRGFTLVELLVTVAVVAILAAIAFPSFEGSMRSNRVATASNELMASLALARSEAIRNPGGAGICGSQDGSACNGDWDDGWMIWIDENGTGFPDPGAGERVLRYVEGRDKLSVVATSTGAAEVNRKFLFDRRGRVDQLPRTLTVQPQECPQGHELVRTLKVGITGQVTLERGECT